MQPTSPMLAEVGSFQQPVWLARSQGFHSEKTHHWLHRMVGLVVYRWWFEKKHQQKHLEVSTNHWCKKLLTTQKLVLCNCLNFNPLRLRQVLARAAEIQVPDSEEILWWFYGRFFVVDWLVDWYKMRVLNHSDLQWCNFCCIILTCKNIISLQAIGLCESGGFASQQRALLGSHASCGGLCGGEGFRSRGEWHQGFASRGMFLRMLMTSTGVFRYVSQIRSVVVQSGRALNIWVSRLKLFTIGNVRQLIEIV